MEELRDALRRAGIPLEVQCGGELSHERVGGLSQADLEILANGPRGRRWLLLEAPLTGLSEEFSAAAEELRERGWGVVVAHPERSLLGSSSAWRLLERELDAGSAMQVNAWSVAGLYGDAVRRDAERVLASAPRAVIASDAHGPQRMPALGLALDALTRAGARDAVRHVSTLPQALLDHGLRPASLIV